MLNSEVPSQARCSSQTRSLCLLQKFWLLATSHSYAVLTPDFISSWNLLVLHFINFFLSFQIKGLSQNSMSAHDYIIMLLKKKSVLPDWYNDWKIRVSEVWAWVCEATFANSESASVTQLCLLHVWKMYVVWTATEILSSGETVAFTRALPEEQC